MVVGPAGLVTYHSRRRGAAPNTPPSPHASEFIRPRASLMLDAWGCPPTSPDLCLATTTPVSNPGESTQLNSPPLTSTQHGQALILLTPCRRPTPTCCTCRTFAWLSPHPVPRTPTPTAISMFHTTTAAPLTPTPPLTRPGSHQAIPRNASAGAGRDPVFGTEQARPPPS